MTKSAPPIRMVADAWWYYYREGLIDRVRCVVPLPVHKNPELTSTIGSYSLGNGVRGRLVGALMQRQLPVLHQALNYRRRRILDRWGRVELVDAPFIEMPSRLE